MMYSCSPMSSGWTSHFCAGRAAGVGAAFLLLIRIKLSKDEVRNEGEGTQEDMRRGAWVAVQTGVIDRGSIAPGENRSVMLAGAALGCRESRATCQNRPARSKAVLAEAVNQKRSSRCRHSHQASRAT